MSPGKRCMSAAALRSEHSRCDIRRVRRLSADAATDWLKHSWKNMYPAKFQYHPARSFAEASEKLAQLGDGAKLLVGGQTLIPLLKLRLVAPRHLVDLGRAEQGRHITLSGELLRIGALTTHAMIAQEPAAAIAPLMHDCAAGIADPQVRNMGTIGGSLAEADPCSCWPTLLCALDARVECAGPEGIRWQSVRELLREPFAPSLRAAELIRTIEIRRPAAASTGAFVAFKRCAQAYPTGSCAAILELDGEHCVRACITLGCMGLTPIVADAAAEALRGQRLTEECITHAADLAAQATAPLPDNKGSVDYKRALARALVRKAIGTALARARHGITEPTHSYYGH